MEYLAAPLAYFITWTTYGSRLHGDPRGTVDDGFNRPGAPLRPPNSALLEYETTRLRSPPLILDDAMRSLVDGTIREHCRLKQWKLWAVNVRTNHVHVVVTTPSETTPQTVEGQLKAWGTRRLREAGLLPSTHPVWTKHGSRRRIWNDEGLAGAIDYVVNQQ